MQDQYKRYALISLPVVFMAFVLSWALVATAHQSRYFSLIIVAPDGSGEVTYWLERHPKNKYGWCAVMYGENDVWYAEHPTGLNSETVMSIGDDIHRFSSQKDATAWAEEKCK